MEKIFFFLALYIYHTCAMAQGYKPMRYKNYYASAQTSLLKGAADEYTTIGAFAEGGKYIKNNFSAGAGAGFINFQNSKKAIVLYLSIEKNIGANKRKLFFYGKPGIAFAWKPVIQLQEMAVTEYWKKRPGLYLQAGSGIKWMVGRHNFFISTGLCTTGYTIYAKEYPVPVDPYNPFIEAAIMHKYQLTFTKLIFNAGFTL